MTIRDQAFELITTTDGLLQDFPAEYAPVEPLLNQLTKGFFGGAEDEKIVALMQQVEARVATIERIRQIEALEEQDPALENLDDLFLDEDEPVRRRSL